MLLRAELSLEDILKVEKFIIFQSKCDNEYSLKNKCHIHIYSVSFWLT